MENKYYVLRYKCFDSGFFCHFFYILGGVNYSVNHNLKPIVDWTHIFNIYGDSSRLESNPFEYFFNQKYSLNELVENSYIIAPDGFSKDVWPEDHIPYGVQGLKLRDHKDIVTKFNKVFSDNFSIKEDILNEINPEITKYKTLGVHCRRSDMVLGHPEHALVHDLNETYDKVLRVFENGQYETYFTEKLLDCFATGTIPVYLGAPDIGNYFNKDGIIDLTDEFEVSDEIYFSKMDA